MKKHLLFFLALASSFLVQAQSINNVNLLFNWADTSLPGSTAYNNTYNEIWGLAINGREYAVIGSTMGTHFFDVTDVTDVRYIDFIPGGEQGPVVVHRDYHDFNGYLYMVCDEGNNSTLQIADLQYLPDSVHLVYDSKTIINKSHNIFIDTATARLYVCSIKKGNGTVAAMSIYSLADPLAPLFLADWNGAGHVHDAYVINDTAFLNCGYDGLHIVDFTNPTMPVKLDEMKSYPQQGYNHSGWLSEDRSIYIFTDENPSLGLKVCDATDLSDLKIESIIKSGVDTNSMAHNVIIKDKIAYISYYHDGLYMFNVTDPKNPKKIGWYDTYTYPDHLSYRGAWGVYPFLPSGNVLISDMQFGLFVFDVSDAVGIHSISAQMEGLRIFPNPAGDFLNINLPATGTYIQVYDILGNVVIEKNISQSGNFRLDLPAQMSEGVYFIKAVKGSKTYTQKFIKVN